jgi:Rhodanese-like domain
MASSPERSWSPATSWNGGWPRQASTATPIPNLDDHVILLCDEGYQSSLAAAMLQQLGFTRETDVEGGFQAWRAAALPVEQPTTWSPAPTRKRTEHPDLLAIVLP